MSVRPLIASTATDSRQALLGRLRRDGALYFPSLLPKQRVADLRAKFVEVLSAHDWLADDRRPEALIPRGSARHGAPGWWRMYQAMQSLEHFHALAHAPELLDVVKRVLGGRVLNHPRRQVTMVSPGFWIPPHQEQLYVQGTADVLTAWLPFDAGQGPQVLAEDTPRRLRAVSRDRHNGVGITLADVEDTWATAEGEFCPGDMLLVHAMAVRRTDRHTGDDLRLSAEFRYQPAFEPVVRGSLMPHHYPRLPAWPKLTSGWASRRWVRAPLVKHVVDFRMPPNIEEWHLLVPDRRSALVDITAPSPTADQTATR